MWRHSISILKSKGMRQPCNGLLHRTRSCKQRLRGLRTSKHRPRYSTLIFRAAVLPEHIRLELEIPNIHSWTLQRLEWKILIQKCPLVGLLPSDHQLCCCGGLFCSIKWNLELPVCVLGLSVGVVPRDFSVGEACDGIVIGVAWGDVELDLRGDVFLVLVEFGGRGLSVVLWWEFSSIYKRFPLSKWGICPSINLQLNWFCIPDLITTSNPRIGIQTEYTCQLVQSMHHEALWLPRWKRLPHGIY
jgi:hypothetical protein